MNHPPRGKDEFQLLVWVILPFWWPLTAHECRFTRFLLSPWMLSRLITDWRNEAHRQDNSVWKMDHKADTYVLWLEMRSMRNHENHHTGHLSLETALNYGWHPIIIGFRRLQTTFHFVGTFPWAAVPQTHFMGTESSLWRLMVSWCS